MYTIQIRNQNKQRGSFGHMGPNEHTVPNKHELQLFSAVNSALLAGLTYNSDVYAHVVDEMTQTLSQETLDAGKDRAENGWFGYDIYCMRKDVVQPMIELALNKAAMAAQKIRIGDKVKNLSFGGHKFSTVTITHVDKTDGSYGFSAKKRGTKSIWTGCVKANDSGFNQAIKELKYPSHIKETIAGNIRTITINLQNPLALNY